MEKFTGESILEFTDKFKTDLDCLEYLAEIKWKEGFKCVKCNHTKFTIRKKNFARDCNACHHIESPIVDTIFHRVRFGLRKAFTIVFEMSATTKSLSTRQMAKRLKIRPRIAGADVPEKKRIVISLCYIYGIGRTLSTKILAKAKIDESTRAKDLTEEQLTTLKNIIDGFGFPIEGELRRIVFQNIKRKKDIQSYQGVRHQKNLPVRGQKTQKNARTKRGKRVAVGGANPKATTKT